jgi:hypothetical protein
MSFLRSLTAMTKSCKLMRCALEKGYRGYKVKRGRRVKMPHDEPLPAVTQRFLSSSLPSFQRHQTFQSS